MDVKNKTPTSMTALLRQALAEAESFRSVEATTGIKRQSLMKFARGEQSLRPDIADKLAAHFGIVCRKEER